MKFDIDQLVEDFVLFGKNNLYLNDLDAVYAKNLVYDFLNIYPSKEVKAKKIDDVNYFVDAFTNYYKLFNIDEINIGINISHLFSIISPRPSETNDIFNFLYKKSPSHATEFLYKLGINNYYIHKRDIDKNVEWKTNFKDSTNIEISINLSKPEKNNKDIAKLLSASQSDFKYPKCVLCLENLGFKGDIKKAPRHNIRIIPLKINNEDWFMQYSPYGYFNEHMILVDYKHENMEISKRIFANLIDFVNKFPHYTICSNSDLPIVGGSILNHEHFQGGNYKFPLQKAKDLFVVKNSIFKKVKISFLDFYNTAFKFVSKDKNQLLEALNYCLLKWFKYTDKDVNIFAASSDGKRQNTFTPICSINKNKEYEFIVILRNNGTSNEYPDGIFHVHPEYFAIKKEGIGVIEAMGRFILPARLLRQIKEVDDAVKNKLSEKQYLKKYPDLDQFKNMINYLKENKSKTSKDYINDVCKNILMNVSVFKKDKEGFAHLDKFIKSLKLN